MKRTLLVGLAATLILGLHASAAPRTITRIYGPPGELCSVSAPCDNTFAYPIEQGKAPIIDVEGQYVDLSTGLEVTGSGVTVSTPAGGTSSSNHKIKVSVSSDADPGVRTIKLHYAVELNGPDTFKIRVLRAGRITGIPEVHPADYFNDVNVALNGTKLDNANVIMLPEKIGTFSVGGAQVPQVVTLTQSTGSASIVSSSSTQTVVKVHFDGGPFAEGKGTLLLYDKQLDGAEYRDVCKQHRSFCYGGLDSSSTNESTFHAVGPNAVSSITFPLGGTVAPGSPLTIQVKLVRPARPGGEVVEWDVVPANSFSQASGSGTTFSPSAHNRVNVAAGDQLKQITVEFV